MINVNNKTVKTTVCKKCVNRYNRNNLLKYISIQLRFQYGVQQINSIAMFPKDNTFFIQCFFKLNMICHINCKTFKL